MAQIIFREKRDLSRRSGREERSKNHQLQEEAHWVKRSWNHVGAEEKRW